MRSLDLDPDERRLTIGPSEGTLGGQGRYSDVQGYITHSISVKGHHGPGDVHS